MVNMKGTLTYPEGHPSERQNVSVANILHH